VTGPEGRRLSVNKSESGLGGALAIPMDGVLVIDKPAGPTSHDVVARVRCATGLKKVGHTGTLDPMATGVLPLVLGRGTRLAQFLSGAEKTYEAEIRLGRATDTYDASGAPQRSPDTGTAVGNASPAWDSDANARAGAPIDAGEIRRALSGLTGTYLQSPPPFSAKKIAGVRSYEMARDGRPVQPRPVSVTVRELSVLAIEETVVVVRLTCSAGFYVRALAHELGSRLGVGGHLQALRRTRSGEFTLEHAVKLELVERERAAALDRLIPLERTLESLPSVVLTADGERRALHGAEIGGSELLQPLPEPLPERVRLFGGEGRLLGVAERGSRPGVLHPVVVLG
jgi:tRNA pseudouridine55 synthase